MTRSASTKKTARPKTTSPRGTTQQEAALPAPDARKPGKQRTATKTTERGAKRKSDPAARSSSLEPLVERLAAALADMPRAADFEPLAEHLYTFAQAAPALDESLHTLPGTIETLREALAQVQETTSTLDDLHSSFSLAFLKLPSASDYEPLVLPLVAFAQSSPVLLERLEETLRAVTCLTRTLEERPPADELRVLAEPARELALVAPALSEALSRLPPLVEPLTRSLSELSPLADRMHAAAERMAPTRSVERRSARLEPGDEAREAALSRITEAREAILDALAGLPREEDYAPFARQLREIASVSPSLLSWLREVPKVSAPLAASVRALLVAAESLKEARALLES